MRERGASGFFRAAYFCDNDRLIVLPSLSHCFKKGGNLRNAFDVARNDTNIIVTGEMKDIVGEGQPDLFPAGYQIGQRSPATLYPATERLHQHPALRNESDGAVLNDTQMLIRNG